MKITFNQLRKIKDSLPDGSVHKIAQKLNINVEAVYNYFGSTKYAHGNCIGLHIEQGPDGGIVQLYDTRILEMAKEIISNPEHLN